MKAIISSITITLLLLVNTTYAQQYRTVEKEVKYYVKWFENIVPLTATQHDKMIAVRTEYVKELRTWKAKKYTEHHEKLTIDKRYWKNRDKVLSETQVITLRTYLTTKHEVDQLDDIIHFSEVQKEEFFNKILPINRNLVMASNEFGIYNASYLAIEEESMSQKDKLKAAMFTAKQQHDYILHKSSYEKKVKGFTDAYSKNELEETETYNLLEPTINK
ncbi:hypothetical protein [Flammeovirga kamogawensis]|uniref:DUF3826 domain-containing protein n=1 Tax=Flammeovirga kamogawensis TaxID=373891 RepID=A0ABX8H263_9BACT|nr:hypothetical protein [Flammeovirga kamogawensis]MBB6462388.1 hypothetical protein [Flammeovirga kamogawensis]QWG09501.1 hypothetical protein KM029_23120 [Flammeovirga kamogawensis]TRX65017.1 hypothetical protein EO216_21020 [Flammeovirga kamogawensis]